MVGGGTPGDAFYDASTGTNRGYGSPGPVRRSPENERMEHDTGRARLVIALVLAVLVAALVVLVLLA